MDVNVLTALGIGFLGSFHCIGMCGPIALALPGAPTGRSLLIGRIVYNFGRTVTYAFIGLIAGSVGQAVVLAGWQETLSIGLGVVILLVVLIPRRIWSRITNKRPADFMVSGVNAGLGRLFKNARVRNLFLIGLLNGFLPCGLVYFAAAGAAATGNAVKAVEFMILFGLGTIPVMLAMTLAHTVLSRRVRSFLNRLIPVGAVLLALLLIARGMSLGIPYISPVLDQPMQAEEEPRCH